MPQPRPRRRRRQRQFPPESNSLFRLEEQADDEQEGEEDDGAQNSPDQPHYEKRRARPEDAPRLFRRCASCLFGRIFRPLFIRLHQRLVKSVLVPLSAYHEPVWTILVGVLFFSYLMILINCPVGVMIPSLIPRLSIESSINASSSFSSAKILPFQPSSPSSSLPWVMFYHIYLPDKPTALRRALEVIQDQLDQIGESYAATAAHAEDMEDDPPPGRPKDGNEDDPALLPNKKERKLTVWYVTVGRRRPPGFDRYMHYHCSVRHDFRCQALDHVEQGQEEVTLQHVYDYCRPSPGVDDDEEHYVQQPDPRWVIYLHAKGSFHATPENNRWRRHLTAAVTHRDCLPPRVARPPPPHHHHRQPRTLKDPSPQAQKCNVCGLQFYPVWAFFFPGNFWSASCTHIQQLIPPRNFTPLMSHLTQDLLVLETPPLDQNISFNQLHGSPSHFQPQQKQRLLATLFDPKSPGYIGVDRYAAEHWIGSHPSIRPCDLSTTADLLYWRHEEQPSIMAPFFHPWWRTATKREEEYRNWTWAMAPRHGLQSASWYRLDQQQVEVLLQHPDQLHREYYLLAGQVAKWQHLYPGQRPESDSWIWKFFPDGDYWKQQPWA